MQTFKQYFDTYLEEKGIDQETLMCFDTESGANFMPVSVVVERTAMLPKPVQKKIKHNLVMIDFKNGDPMHFIQFMAVGIAEGKL